MKNAKLFLILLCVLLFMGTPSITLGDWYDGMPYKWVQHPDLTPMGIDINGTIPYKLADDFECIVTGPLTDFHIWCSWLYDEVGDPLAVDFTIEIYDDIPASESPTGYSMPGNPLWGWFFAAGDFVALPYATVDEGWMDPPDFYIFPPADFTCWQYNFYVPEGEEFIQEGTPDRPVIYWIAIQAMPHDFGLWGWKTRDPYDGHFNDDAVWTDGAQIWQELRYPPGHELEGHSIDLAFVITGQDIDFGDAPEYDPTGVATQYPTTLANDGARHTIVPGVFLGNLVDPEPDGQPTLPADGDDLDVLYPSMGDDEDGVSFLTPLIPGQPAQIQVTASVPGFLYAWVDFDANFSWAEASDLIFNGTALNAGPNVLTFNVPNSAAPMTTTYARFRYVTTAVAALSYKGLAPDGEVEDHTVFIEEGEEKLKFQQLPLNGVVIGDIPYYGHDELSTAYRVEDALNLFEGCYMADDFADLENTPVIRIKWWGSYLENEIVEPVIRFMIAFEKDVPADDPGNPVPWSHPGEVIQTQFVVLNTAGGPLNPGEYSEKLVPSPGPGIPCEQLFEYEAILENPFPQEPDTVYWIKIVALVEDPAVWARIMQAMVVYPGTLCEFLNLPFAQQQLYGLEIPVTRWGWHNRDYTQMDPYASTPPAVIPGEHIAGVLSDGTTVWHFQDNAVSGDVLIDEATPDMPWVDQPWWTPEYYKWYWELCPNLYDIDGPPEIEEFSKDLAFELWTETEEEEKEKIKFEQLPLNGVVIADIPYYGHDELSTAYRNMDLPEEFIGCYMADDFADLEHSPVIKIKWWGSYLENEIMESVDRFLIAFETDVPADTGVDPPWSHPGELLQSQFVHRSSVVPLQRGEFSETMVPSPGATPCEWLYEYEAILENPFPEDPNIVYWLKIVALIDDPSVWARLQPALLIYPGPMCEFLNLPFAQQQLYGLEIPVTRWGWHNRDYTKMDPYASTPPAVVPGEHIQGFLFPGTMLETPIWHFQDDAVSGEVYINEAATEMPWVDQPWWNEEYYKWYWELCPYPYDIDGPEGIDEYSKDLAFELWTSTNCRDKIPASELALYDRYVTAGFFDPSCWCWQYQCYGDADNAEETVFITGTYRIYQGDLNLLIISWKLTPETGANPCADINHAEETVFITGTYSVYQADLNIVITNWTATTASLTPDCPSY